MPSGKGEIMRRIIAWWTRDISKRLREMGYEPNPLEFNTWEKGGVSVVIKHDSMTDMFYVDLPL